MEHAIARTMRGKFLVLEPIASNTQRAGVPADRP